MTIAKEIEDGYEEVLVDACEGIAGSASARCRDGRTCGADVRIRREDDERSRDLVHACARFVEFALIEMLMMIVGRQYFG